MSQAPGKNSAAGPADLVVAFVPGVLPDKWLFRWRDRHPGLVLEERPIEEESWRQELGEARAHACFVRLPADPQPDVDDLTALRREFRAVALYEEQQVVVLPRDHELSLLDEVPAAELVHEVLLQQAASLPEQLRGAAAPGPRHAREAIELVAAGAGLLVVPMSVARLHHRRDLVHRVVPDLATVPVVLVWPQDLPEEQEDLVQDFVGVVRGRGLNSSRGGGSAGTPPATQTRAAAAGKEARASSSRRADRSPQGARRGGAGARSGRRSGGRSRR